MQVWGGQRVTLTPGRTFYEGPNDVCVVGRNASQTKTGEIRRVITQRQRCPCSDPREVGSYASVITTLEGTLTTPRDYRTSHAKGIVMKIVVIGGSGLIPRIGKKANQARRDRGHFD